MSLLHILLELIDPTQNMARYYVLSIEPTLFGDSALVREWCCSPQKPGHFSRCCMGRDELAG